MTVEERRNPKIINGSRRARVAAGSGVTVGEVNNLIVRFLEGQKMMRQMMGGMGMPGMRRGGQKAKGKGKKKGKGGGRPANAGGRTSGQGPGPAGGSAPATLPGIPAGFGKGVAGGLPGTGPAGLPDGLGGGEGAFRLPGGRGPGFPAPKPNLPPGLRGPVPNRRGRGGTKGR
jgi:signal recognition particle subunit SRP54